MRYELGTSAMKHHYYCLECAEKDYEKIEGLKYLAECDSNDKPIKILKNTYGWKNVEM